MKKYLLNLALSSLVLGLVLNCSVEAQQPGVVVSQAPVVSAPAPVVMAPTAPPATASITTSATVADAASGAECVKTKKICVTEEKKQTKIQHGSRCKDYCRPSCTLCNLFTIFGGNDGCSSCQEKSCGKVKTHKVLVKYVVDDCPKKVCVVKEVPDDTPAKCEVVTCEPVKCEGATILPPAITSAPSVTETIIEPASKPITSLPPAPSIVTEPPLASHPLPAGPSGTPAPVIPPVPVPNK